MNLIKEIKHLLGNEIYKSGAAFYSSATTLKQGKFMIIGLNPGGDPDDETTIEASLNDCLEHDYNAFYENWNGNNKHRLQENLKSLFSFLGEELKEVCAFNLFFERTKSQKQLSLEALPIYREILLKIVDVVKPKVIFTFGKLPLAEIKMLLTKAEIEETPSGHGNWQITLCSGIMDGQLIKIVGFPLLSVYTLYNRPEQLQMVRRFVNS